MPDGLLTALGLMLIALVAYDVYATILHARGRGGPLSESLNRTIWRLARAAAFVLPRPRRHRLLNTVAPALMPALIALYIVILIFGFALIYLPRMPARFVIAEGAERAGPLVESLYFSGVTLTTVGYGDILPRTTAMRFVALAQGASGFALISLAVTYLITVYGALERKRAVALSFYHQAEEGADVAGFIAHHFVGGRFYGIEATLRIAARDVQQLLEAHVEHPIIHYFHPVEVHKGMPRMLFLSLETCAVIDSCLDGGEYPETVNHPEVRTLDASARHVLAQFAAHLRLGPPPGKSPEEATPEEDERWRRRHRRTLKQIARAGVKTRPDAEGGWEAYRARRGEWEPALRRYSEYLGYEWEEITGDRNLRYAADEEMEQPER